MPANKQWYDEVNRYMLENRAYGASSKIAELNVFEAIHNALISNGLSTTEVMAHFKEKYGITTSVFYNRRNKIRLRMAYRRPNPPWLDTIKVI